MRRVHAMERANDATLGGNDSRRAGEDAGRNEIRMRHVWNARRGAKGLSYAHELRRSDRNRGFGKASGGDRNRSRNPAGRDCESHARSEAEIFLRDRRRSNLLLGLWLNGVLRVRVALQPQDISSCELEEYSAAHAATGRRRQFES